jgi:hypothetical protein
LTDKRIQYLRNEAQSLLSRKQGRDNDNLSSGEDEQNVVPSQDEASEVNN